MSKAENMAFLLFYLRFDSFQHRNFSRSKSNFIKQSIGFFITVVGKVKAKKTHKGIFEKFQENALNFNFRIAILKIIHVTTFIFVSYEAFRSILHRGNCQCSC